MTGDIPEQLGQKISLPEWVPKATLHPDETADRRLVLTFRLLADGHVECNSNAHFAEINGDEMVALSAALYAVGKVEGDKVAGMLVARLEANQRTGAIRSIFRQARVFAENFKKQQGM